jgi:hypothetical protein
LTATGHIRFDAAALEPCPLSYVTAQ